ncbi:hypothetical protein ACSVBT_07180 [Afipia sp. TerB]
MDEDRIAYLHELADERRKAWLGKWLAVPGVREALERRPTVSDKAVQDFTRVCEQTGMIEQLRKE